MKKVLNYTVSVIFTILIVAMGAAVFANAEGELQSTVVLDEVEYSLVKNEQSNKMYYNVTGFTFDEFGPKPVNSHLVIRSEIDGVPVKRIALSFNSRYDSPTEARNYDIPEITEITIPDSIEYIGSYSFYRFVNVESLKIPEKVSVIGKSAFAGMKKLKAITLPSKITKIRKGLFASCKNLEKVTFKGKITDIGEDAFAGCEKLSSLRLPSSLELIHSGAFWKSGLKSITIPKNTELLYWNTFLECSALEKVIFEDGRSKELNIPDSAFCNCPNLKSIKFPNKLKSIGTCAFYNTGFTSIRIPKGVAIKNSPKTAYGCFMNCKNLKKVVFEGLRDGKNLVLPMKMFQGCTKLEKVYFPKESGKIYIKAYAFKNCTSLSKIYNTANIVSIGEEAFRNCKSLTKFTFSSKLKTVKEKAFYNCTNLAKITLDRKKTAPDILENALKKTKTGIKFYTQNDKVASSLKSKLKGSGAKKAKIYVA